MRTQANGFSLPGKERRPQIFDPDVLPVWTPLRAAAHAALSLPRRRRGRLRPHRPADHAPPRAGRTRRSARRRRATTSTCSAPTCSPRRCSTRARRRGTLYVPRGPLDRPLALGLAGARRTRARRRETVAGGGRNVTCQRRSTSFRSSSAPARSCRCFPPTSQTLTTYGRGVVHLADREGERRLLAWPRGASAAPLGPGERVGSLERRRSWTLTFRGRRTRTYRLQASLGAMKRAFRPCAISVRGRRLRRGRAWTYDRADDVLRATFRLRSGRAVIKRC